MSEGVSGHAWLARAGSLLSPLKANFVGKKNNCFESDPFNSLELDCKLSPFPPYIQKHASGFIKQICKLR